MPRTRLPLRHTNSTARDGTRRSIRAVGGETRRFVTSGNIAAATGVARFYIFEDCVFDGLYTHLATAPAGSAALLDINRNGTTIFTTQANRPSIAAGANTGTVGEPSVVAFSAGDIITVDVDQVGSGTAGAGLTFELRTRPPEVAG